MTRLVALGFTLALTFGWSVAVEATGSRIGGGAGVRGSIHGHSGRHRDLGGHAFGGHHNFGRHQDHTFAGHPTFGWHRNNWPSNPGFVVSPPNAPCRDHGGRWTCVDPRAHHHRHGHVIVAPQPIWVAPGRSCFEPGYWAYEWIPQTSWQTVYVPGYWATDGSWVASHYAQQPYATGAYHPVWVPERWAC